MIELIPDLPGNVVGAIAAGHVTGQDYESVLIPAVENAIRAHGRVRFLYHLGPGFEGYSAAVAWDDTRLGLAHLKAWERLAVVTDKEWVAAAMRVFAFATPCPVKVFPNSRHADVLDWIGRD
jgi:hypothetical protein